jgi:hypothetical protein
VRKPFAAMDDAMPDCFDGTDGRDWNAESLLVSQPIMCATAAA